MPRKKPHHTLQDALLRVPLIMKFSAGMKARPGVRTHLAEQVDLSAMLYDLSEDPGETRNRSGDLGLAAVERTLELRLLDFFMQTGDVLPHHEDPRSV